MPAITSRNVPIADSAARAFDPLDTMTPEEDAEITAAARRDRDSPPLFWEDEAGPGEWAWLDLDLIERLRADGPDWELRANQILRKALDL